MEALKFMSEWKRLCDSIDICPNCPLYKLSCDARPNCRCKKENEEIVSKVEEWSNNHPRITRAARFLAQYPDAPISEVDGLPKVTPCHISKEYETKMKQKCGLWDNCSGCRKEFWNSEVSKWIM